MHSGEEGRLHETEPSDLSTREREQGCFQGGASLLVVSLCNKLFWTARLRFANCWEITYVWRVTGHRGELGHCQGTSRAGNRSAFRPSTPVCASEQHLAICNWVQRNYNAPQVLEERLVWGGQPSLCEHLSKSGFTGKPVGSQLRVLCHWLSGLSLWVSVSEADGQPQPAAFHHPCTESRFPSAAALGRMDPGLGGWSPGIPAVFLLNLTLLSYQHSSLKFLKRVFLIYEIENLAYNHLNCKKQDYRKPWLVSINWW